MTATIHNDGAAAILLRACLNNAGWETRTGPNGTIEIHGGDSVHHVHVRPVAGHGSRWWHWGPQGGRGRSIVPVGDIDRAVERITNTVGPPPANR